MHSVGGSCFDRTLLNMALLCIFVFVSDVTMNEMCVHRPWAATLPNEAAATMEIDAKNVDLPEIVIRVNMLLKRELRREEHQPPFRPQEESAHRAVAVDHGEGHEGGAASAFEMPPNLVGMALTPGACYVSKKCHQRKPFSGKVLAPKCQSFKAEGSCRKHRNTPSMRVNNG